MIFATTSETKVFKATSGSPLRFIAEKSLGSKVFTGFRQILWLLADNYTVILIKFEFSRRSTFRLKLRHFWVGKNYENLPEFRIVPIIYDHDCLRKQFCAILEIQEVTLKFKFRYFSLFLSYL